MGDQVTSVHGPSKRVLLAGSSERANSLQGCQTEVVWSVTLVCTVQRRRKGDLTGRQSRVLDVAATAETGAAVCFRTYVVTGVKMKVTVRCQ